MMGAVDRERTPCDYLAELNHLSDQPIKSKDWAFFPGPVGSQLCLDSPVTSVSFRTFRTVWHQAKNHGDNLMPCSPLSGAQGLREP